MCCFGEKGKKPPGLFAGAHSLREKIFLVGSEKKKMSKFRVGEDKREELDWKTTTMKEKSRLDVVVQASNPSCG